SCSAAVAKTMCPLPDSSPAENGRVVARQPENEATIVQPPEYSAEERNLLLRLAHEAINTALADRELEAPSLPEHLQQPRGAFTTLYLDGEVRGCVGYVFAAAPLFQTVIETARAAAFNDARFPPVT